MGLSLLRWGFCVHGASLTPVGAAPNHREDGALEVQQGGLPGRDPHAAALGAIGPLEQLLEVRGVGSHL